MKFSELNLSTKLMDAIDDLGFIGATEIQYKAIPLLLEGKDFIGQSQTGSGKTIAFGIPIIEKLDPSLNKTQAIILCPTRELAVQVKNEIDKLLVHYRNIRTLAVYGGDPISNQIRNLRRGAHIIIGTPGRVLDHINRGTVKLGNVNTFVLDEADEMLNMGFREDIELVASKIPEDKQMVLFSATMPKSIVQIAKVHQKNPVHVTIKRESLTTETIEQMYVSVQSKHKFEVLTRLIDSNEAKLNLIFCNTKRKVDELNDMLQSRGYKCDKLHGDLNQTLRLSVLSKFNRGVVKILIATDVAARGIDINDIDVVYNYDLPDNEEYYVHRIGRTGRAGRKGKTFCLVGRSEQRKLHNIERYIKLKIKQAPIPSVEAVNKSKINSFYNNLIEKLESDKLDDYTKIIDEWIEKGVDLKTLSAALLKTQFVLQDPKQKSLEVPANERRRLSGSKNGMTRMHINIGRKHKVRVVDIIDIVSKNSNIPRSAIGTIDLFDKYSFVEIPDRHTKKAIQAVEQKNFNGKKLSLEVSSSVKRTYSRDRKQTTRRTYPKTNK
ncbi:DEAD/DEAH box helicase [Helicovermis profundi]|uniref:DEAD/DEAH box helicase n=1 Tax=Helicovermis profundi TaxID=3065157 RepID=A0AAU9E5N3_9FIRM|nr:DEAD/DEAH box helicase [Clostridia bacterium S502]